VHPQRDERFARAGGRTQDHVVAGGKVHEGILLMRPGLDAARLHPGEEEVERIALVDPEALVAARQVRILVIGGGPPAAIDRLGQHPRQRSGREGVVGGRATTRAIGGDPGRRDIGAGIPGLIGPHVILRHMPRSSSMVGPPPRGAHPTGGIRWTGRSYQQGSMIPLAREQLLEHPAHRR